MTAFCDPDRIRTCDLLLRHTTIVFTTISVCGLDYIITFDFTLRYFPLSLYTFNHFWYLARYCHHHYVLRFHRIREVLLYYF